MIGKLIGTIELIWSNNVMIRVDKTSYVLQVDLDSVSNFREQEGETSIFVTTVTNEYQRLLFGFDNFAKKLWFEELAKIKGISNRIALSILGEINIELLQSGSVDQTMLRSVHGIGERLSEQIAKDILRIPKKITNISTQLDGTLKANITDSLSAKSNNVTNHEELLTSLTSLGFGYSESQAAILEATKMINTKQVATENILKLCLQFLDK